ncbi:MAG TPA: peptidyl-prolyl cis-trans isomerase [Thermoanaerobaculia bacterium]|nr:peptidyl-prolyl cis-trans isomerase [Thermoanaerobaculia bacterium]
MPRRLVSLSLLLALALAPAMVPALSAEVLNRVVLRVNDQISTLYDYQLHREELVRDIVRREQDGDERQRLLSQVGEVAYADLFRELLLQSRADQLGVEVTDAQVDAAMSQLKQSYNLKSDEEFKAALAQSGMTDAQLRAQLRGQLRVQEVRGREVQSRVKVDEEDQRRYYRKNLEQFRQPEQVQLREVVVLDEGGLPTAEERQRAAAEIRAKVRSGGSLADAVADTSKKGVTSAAIDLGWVSPGDLDKNLETAVWKLPKGSLSEPVQARGGLHLVQVLDRRESRIPPFSEVQQVIQTREQERVFRQEIAKYMVELEKKSLVVAKPPADAANFRRHLAVTEAAGDEGGLSGGIPAAAAAATSSAAPVAGEATPLGTVTTPPTATTTEPTAPGTLPVPKPVDPSPAPVAPPPSTTEPPPAIPPPGV